MQRPPPTTTACITTTTTATISPSLLFSFSLPSSLCQRHQSAQLGKSCLCVTTPERHGLFELKVLLAPSSPLNPFVVLCFFPFLLPPSHKIMGLATSIPPAFALSCLYFKNPFDDPGLASSLGALGYPSVANRVTWCIFFSFSFSFSPFLPSFCFSPSLLILALSNSEATGSRSSIVAVTAPWLPSVGFAVSKQALALPALAARGPSPRRSRPANFLDEYWCISCVSPNYMAFPFRKISLGVIYFQYKLQSQAFILAPPLPPFSWTPSLSPVRLLNLAFPRSENF